MKKGTKKWIIICAVILIAAAGIACWLIFGKEKPKAAESAGGAFRPALDTQITGSVNVVGHYDNFEALEAEFNLFNQIYPNVELKYTKLDNYSGTIGAALHSEEAPDIFFMYPSTVQRNEEAVMGAAENLADEKLGMDLSCVRSSLCSHLRGDLRDAGQRGSVQKGADRDSEDLQPAAGSLRKAEGGRICRPDDGL